MIKEIERPDWINITYNLGYGCPVKVRSVRYLDRWFDQTIEPLNKAIREGVEVYGPFETKEAGPSNSHTYLAKGHKALLIGIEPIKKENAADVLSFILDNAEKAKANLEMDSFINEVSRRAKAALANEGQGDE